MRDPIARSIGLELARVGEFLRSHWRWPSPECGFSAWVFSTTQSAMPFAPSHSVVPEARLGEAPVLASLGYLLAAGEATAGAGWGDGYRRLAKRNAFPADRSSFAFRPLELLGVVLGVTRLPQAAEAVDAAWIKHVVERRLDDVKSADWWTYILTVLAANAVGASWAPRYTLDFAALSVAELAMLGWIGDAVPGVSGPLHLEPHKGELCQLALHRTLEEGLGPRDAAEAALLYATVRAAAARVLQSRVDEFWQASRAERDSHSLVVFLCRRFASCVRQLGRRHRGRDALRITDEYDVQDLMRALLALHFDDVRDEEWTPSYAGNSSRIDFLLKPERIVVEAKMTRPGLNQRQVTDELIVDKERYRSHPDCGTLICFVYDPEGRCENPAALESDVGEPRGTPKVTVVVSPSQR